MGKLGAKESGVPVSPGRDAQSPTDIPARGWWRIATCTVQQISEDRVTSIAAGVTFFGLLAIFPALSSIVSIYGLFTDPVSLSEHLTALSGVLPGGAVDVIGDQVKRLVAQPAGTLGFTLLASLAVSLWSANAGAKSLFDALNIAYGEKETRGFFELNLVTLGFTASALVFLLVALGAMVVLPPLLAYLGASMIAEWAVKIGRWPILLAFVALALSVVYRYAPNRRKPQWRWVTWGSALAAILWIGASLAFTWYAANFGKYNETYGSLGAAIGFMTWMWLSVTVILAGAELNAEMEHQTAKDTTTGPPKPLSERGAAMADHVAEPKQDAA